MLRGPVDVTKAVKANPTRDMAQWQLSLPVCLLSLHEKMTETLFRLCSQNFKRECLLYMQIENRRNGRQGQRTGKWGNTHWTQTVAEIATVPRNCLLHSGVLLKLYPENCKQQINSLLLLLVAVEVTITERFSLPGENVSDLWNLRWLIWRWFTPP